MMKSDNEDVFYIENEATGLVLDVRGTVQLWPINGSRAQRWKWDENFLVNQLNGLVLEVNDEDTPAKNNDGQTLGIGPRNGCPSQQWFMECGNLSNKLHGHCLDIRDDSTYIPGEIVHMWHQRATTYNWTFKLISSKKIINLLNIINDLFLNINYHIMYETNKQDCDDGRRRSSSA